MDKFAELFKDPIALSSLERNRVLIGLEKRDEK
jgi:hypothetical protein